MGQEIEHMGMVHAVNGKNVQVQIIQVSACSGCHAKGACTSADMDEKYVDVDSEGRDFKIGDVVTLYGQASMGFLAVFLAFVLPFLLILAVLIFAGNFTSNEVVSGALGLGVLVPYYIILSFFNEKLKSKLKFRIR
jgi:sigma-E factor negative regulatory protein RseC